MIRSVLVLFAARAFELDVTRMHLVPELYDADGASIDPGIPTMLKPLALPAREIDDLIAALETLSERYVRP